MTDFAASVGVVPRGGRGLTDETGGGVSVSEGQKLIFQGRWSPERQVPACVCARARSAMGGSCGRLLLLGSSCRQLKAAVDSSRRQQL